MPHRYVHLPFPANVFGPHDGQRAVVSNGRVSATVDLQGGASTTTPGEYQATKRDPTSRLGGLVERVDETTDGPRTRLLDATGREVASFMGELVDGSRTGDLLVALVSVPGPRYDIVACALGSVRREVRLPGSFARAIATNASIGAAVVNGLAHVFRREGDRVLSVTVRVPESTHPDVFIEGNDVWLLCTQSLIALDALSLPFAPEHRSLALSCQALVGAARGDAEPAVVAFAITGKLLLDHPRLGRLTVARTLQDPLVVRGDKIRLDDVREELPGLFRVHAWGKYGASASVRPAAPPLEFPAPDIAPLEAPTSAAGQSRIGQGGPLHNAKLMRSVATLWGFSVPPLLDRLLEVTDSDAVMRRWLSQIGFESMEVRSLCADWSADPCVLAFAGMGNGDEYSLYLYPPALPNGEEPPVVEYLHETNGTEFRALTFEGFFDAHLAQWADERAEIVALVRERLGLTLREAVRDEAPPWIPREDARPGTIENARAIEQRGELLAAERAYLAIYTHQGPALREARDALERLYGRLGWNGALASLRLAMD